MLSRATSAARRRSIAQPAADGLQRAVLLRAHVPNTGRALRDHRLLCGLLAAGFPPHLLLSGNWWRALGIGVRRVLAARARQCACQYGRAFLLISHASSTLALSLPLASQICLPDWPWWNRHPLEWLEPLEDEEEEAKEKVKKVKKEKKKEKSK